MTKPPSLPPLNGPRHPFHAGRGSTHLRARHEHGRAFAQVPLLLIDLETEERHYRPQLICSVICRAALPAVLSLVGEVERVVKGNAVKPAELWPKLAQRFTLIGVQGIVRMAMAGFDTACWDALAIASDMPLVRLLGAEPRPIPAYNSCGLGLMDDRGALADEAEKLLAGGFQAIKLRLGYPDFNAGHRRHSCRAPAHR